MITKRLSALTALLASAIFSISAAIPSGYYDTCEGKNKSGLLTALYGKINAHTDVGYDGLWSSYRITDADADGKIVDIYSTKRWTYSTNQCGTYKIVGDCYNREHTVPQSWFNEASPMKADLFHVYPTDGKVNGQRSNYPYGECANGTTLASNNGVDALGKLGACTFSGYTGTVFEPVDEYKGDLARTYFYMAACYNQGDKNVSTWQTSSHVFDGNTYPVFTEWTINLLLKWHRQDPVSQRELDRNEAIYGLQRNRNPFIDHPEMAEYIWGDKKEQVWSATAAVTPVFNTPVNGSTTSLGTIPTGTSTSFVVGVRGTNLSNNVAVSVSGAGFSVSPATLTADAVNAGTNVTLTCNIATDGTNTATLTLTSGSVTNTSTYTVNTVSGLTALAAANVSDESFTARWVDIHRNGANYKLYVKSGSTPVAGYNPKTVAAAAESAVVSGLQPSTTYTYYVEYAGLQSDVVSVTTLAPVPEINISTYDDTQLSAFVGSMSDAITLTLDTENITGDVALSVEEPFRICTDYSVSAETGSWGQSVTMSALESNFYVCLDATEAAAGNYSTSIRATAAGITYDDFDIYGTIRSLTGAEYTITYKSNDSDGSPAFSTAAAYQGQCDDDISKAIATYSSSTRVFPGKSGLKFGNSSNGGELNLSIAEDYQKNYSTVKVVVNKYGNNAGKIALNGGEQKTMSADTEEFVWEISSVEKLTTLSLVSSNRIYVKSITLCEPAPVQKVRVATPVFTPAGGEVDAGEEVEITCATEGAYIYYTLDGTVPTADSDRYLLPIIVTESVTIRAIAVKEGMDNSKVATATFTVVAAPTNPDLDDTEAWECDVRTFDFTTAKDSDNKGAYGIEVMSSGNTFLTHADCVEGPCTLTIDGNYRLWETTSSGNIALRMYKGSSFTIKGDEHHKVIRVKLLPSGAASNFNTEDGNYENGEWRGRADEIKISATHTSGNVEVKTVEVELLQVPTFSLTQPRFEHDATKRISFKCTIDGHHFDHTKRITIWVLDVPESSQSAPQMRAAAVETLVGSAAFSQAELTDKTEASVALSLTPDTGVHNVKIRTAANLYDTSLAMSTHYTEGEPEGSTNERTYAVDTSKQNETIGVGTTTPDTAWSAYCRDHRLVVDSAIAGTLAAVYSVDGICRFEAPLAFGENHIEVQPGLYVIVVGDASRRVLVK